MSNEMVLQIYQQTKSQVGTANLMQVSRQYVHKVLKSNGFSTSSGKMEQLRQERELEAKHFCQNSDCDKNKFKRRLYGKQMVKYLDYWFCSDKCKAARFGD